VSRLFAGAMVLVVGAAIGAVIMQRESDREP
jgi:hypothetical protein